MTMTTVGVEYLNAIMRRVAAETGARLFDYHAWLEGVDGLCNYTKVADGRHYQPLMLLEADLLHDAIASC